MSNELQYLDYEGLKYYDKKLKAQLSNLIPEDGKDGQDGQDGEDGLTPVFRIQDNELQYRYTTEENDDTAWRTLGNVKGEDGSIGEDGTSVTIETTEEVKDDSDNVIGIKITFSDGNEITINHGKDGEDILSSSISDGDDIDIADDGTVNISLSNDFYVREKCGKLAVGDKLEAGLSLYQILDRIMGGVLKATVKTQPSATYTASPSSNQSVEYGTKKSCTITVTPNTNGSYTQYKTDGHTTEDITTTHTVSKNIGVSESDVTINSSTTFKAECVIDSVSVTAKNSDQSDETLTISQKGDKEKTITFTPYLYNFYIKGNLTTSTNDSGDIVIDRTKLTVGNKLVTAKANIDYGTFGSGTANLLGDKSYFFVPAASTTTCPSGFKYKLLADDTTYYPQRNDKVRISGWYKLGKQDTSKIWSDLVVKIVDAGGTLRDYHVYKYKSATPFTNPAFLRFGCVSNTTPEASDYVEYENSSAFFA